VIQSYTTQATFAWITASNVAKLNTMQCNPFDICLINVMVSVCVVLKKSLRLPDGTPSNPGS